MPSSNIRDRSLQQMSQMRPHPVRVKAAQQLPGSKIQVTSYRNCCCTWKNRILKGTNRMDTLIGARMLLTTSAICDMATVN